MKYKANKKVWEWKMKSDNFCCLLLPASSTTVATVQMAIEWESEDTTKKILVKSLNGNAKNVKWKDKNEFQQ